MATHPHLDRLLTEANRRAAGPDAVQGLALARRVVEARGAGDAFLVHLATERAICEMLGDPIEAARIEDMERVYRKVRAGLPDWLSLQAGAARRDGDARLERWYTRWIHYYRADREYDPGG